MENFVFLLTGIGAVITLAAAIHTRQLKATVRQKSPAIHYLPRAISLLLIVAQASELLKMIEHVTIVHVAAAMMLLAITMAGHQEPEVQTRG